MKKRELAEEAFVNSIIGEGTRFRGDLDLTGLLRIDGDFSGTVRTTGKVVVGSEGRADCSIEATVTVIGGVFRGDVYCTERIIVLSSATVIGNLYAPRLVAEEGTLIHGMCVITGVDEFERRTLQQREQALEYDRAVEQGLFRPSGSANVGRYAGLWESSDASRDDVSGRSGADGEDSYSGGRRAASYVNDHSLAGMPSSDEESPEGDRSD